MALEDLLGQPPGAGTDRGSWGEGGIVAKTLDVLSTPQYAIAGGLKSLLDSQNPLEGIVTGVQGRASVKDILTERGMSGPAAWGLGLLGDAVIDPVNYIPFGALVGMGGRAARVSALAGRGMGEAATVLASVESGVTRDMFHVARKMVAREAYNNVIGPIAKDLVTDEIKGQATAAARTAARRLGRDAAKASPDEVMKILGSALDDPSVLQKASPGLMADVSSMFNWAVMKSSDAFRDVTKFGPAGPMFADGLMSAAARRQALAGMRRAHYESAYKGILDSVARKYGKGALEKFTAVADGSELISNLPEELRPLVEMFNADTRQVYKELSEHGVREQSLRWTRALSNLAPAERTTVVAALEGGVAPDTLSSHAKTVFEGISKLPGAKAVLDHESGLYHVVQPLQQVQQYVPRMLTRKGREQLRAWALQNDAELAKTLATAAPNLTVAQARDFIKLVGDGKYLNGDDIMEAFQIRREASFMLPDHMWEHDPRVWMPKWLEHSANRIAHASVWGGSNEKFQSLHDMIKTTTGAAQGNDWAARAVETAWNHYVGKSTRGDASGIVRRLNEASSLMFLGPRTMLLQLTQLSNSVASHGVRNTLAAIPLYMQSLAGDGRLARQVIRSGALIPSVERALEGGPAAERMIKTWHSLLGIRQADSAVRGISAVAASLRVQELAEQLAKSGGRISKSLSEELAALGLDATALSRQAEALTDDQIMTAMRNGANLTQFATRTGDLPRVFHGTGGRFFLKFKSFAFQQSDFINSQIIQKLRHKETFSQGAKRAMAYAATFGWMYSGVAELLSGMQGRDNPTDDDLTYMSNLLLTGALGVWGDTMVGALKGNPALWAGLITGPNVAMLGSVPSSLVQAASQGDPSKLTPINPALLRQPQRLLEYAQNQ